MKKITVIILLAACCSACSSYMLTSNKDKWKIQSSNASDSSIIRIRGLYGKIGKLFYNDSTGSNLADDDVLFSKEDFLLKPTQRQILEAEYTILSKEKDIYSSVKRYSNYYRQYTSYICSNRDTIIVVNMLNSKHIKLFEAIKKFTWIFSENDSFIEKYGVANQSFAVNLRTKEVKSYFDSCSPIKIISVQKR